LRIKGKFNNITIISAYAPTEDKETEIKEQFYDELQNMIDNTPRSDTTIVLGDFSAKFGTEDTYNNVTGKHTLHEQTSENCELLCEFATVNDMQVMSTKFQHKMTYMGTWTSPDQNTINQIDHVLINKKKMDLTEDIRTMRGPSIDSDYYLIENYL
jgi:exonuclease III